MELLTKRLILNPFRLSDAPELQRLVCDPKLAQWTRCFSSPFSIEESVDWLNKTIQKTKLGENVTLSIHLKHGGNLIGAVSFQKKDMLKAEVGYWLGVPFWRKGYCTEALGALIDFSFTTQNVTQIIARCEKDNIASQKVMIRCGMHYVNENQGVTNIKNREVKIVTYVRFR
ncbi:GNAT family N-acetyltransferase [Escherichia coli]|uniref:GNAT family N-acetyltransferase n=1 Tax=Klebsiella sp. RHBSTW-00465 TaxID=2742650 RepID=UPI0015F6C16D|nr:GNAT family N-acetyltransferase [Klebsiella sp. RHBSTW-00465]EEQ3637106.1 GNAT family N-acetyltransferase [Escherichia coli]MBA7847835.1 GNAT family N-acetyltransferase [Klebsiella sp. RHBSTW-00465]HEM8644049.1 GNAT family N-acetyltransferase [Klebsiella aerogenes]